MKRYKVIYMDSKGNRVEEEIAARRHDEAAFLVGVSIGRQDPPDHFQLLDVRQIFLT